MANITYRGSVSPTVPTSTTAKGSGLTNDEVDGNFKSLNDSKLEGTVAVANGGTGLTSYTANGVVYASGTGTLASSSGLVFDGTNFLVGTTAVNRLVTVGVPSAATLNTTDNGVAVVNATSRVSFGVTGASYVYGGAGAASGLLYSINRLNIITDGNSPITFHTGSPPAERMRLDASGNLGIGTTSPGSKLEIRNDVAATTSLDPTAIKLFNNLDGGSGIEFSNSVAGKSKISFGVQSSGAGTDDTYLGFSTSLNGGTLTERMKIDASGNLNIVNLTASKAVFTDASKNLTSTGTVGVTQGGTGLSTIAALSIPVSTTLNTYATVTPTAGQSVRINAGGTAWEAYTPSSGTGSVTGVTGTAPIVSSGGTAPAISISAATISAAGSMSAADKTKLDGIATGATANTGTVTGVSIVSTNGFTGTATATSTPAITLTTSVTGVLKGNGTAISAATAGTDYVSPSVATNFTAPQRPSISAETAPTTNALTWDLTVNSIMRINLNANITTLTLTGTLSTYAGYQYQAVVRYNGGTTITWPATVKFAGGTAPTLTGTSGKVDIFNFIVASNDGGTTFFLLCTGNSQNL